MNILNLPNFKVISTNETEYDLHVRVETISPPLACRHCGSIPNFSRFGTKEQLFMDIPIRNQRVGIIINRQRYKCKECGVVFFEPLDDMDDKRQATKRLISHIETESILRSFTDVADSIGLDEKTVRNVFSEYVDRLEQTIQRVFPTWLGIDEIHIIGKPRGVLTDIGRRLVYDVTVERTKAVLDPYFMSIPLKTREKVQYVTMDMWKPYKDAVYKFFPNASVIVDKYHVVRELNNVIDKMRISYKDSLSKQARVQLKKDKYILRSRRHNLKIPDEILIQTWEGQYPDLYEAYQVKEEFFNIFDTASSSSEAKELLEAWQGTIPKEMKKHMRSILTSLRNWEKEILNYFDCKLTNAYTEGLNGRIRTINKTGRGYSFDVLRAKILLAYGKEKVVKPKYKVTLKKQGERMRTIKVTAKVMSTLLSVIKKIPVDKRFGHRITSTDDLKVTSTFNA